ncbi:MAG: hypothetical protein H7199_03020 [Burkholderiales bacterium]|nr:hypothetical protein [Flavobacterium sp.]
MELNYSLVSWWSIPNPASALISGYLTANPGFTLDDYWIRKVFHQSLSVQESYQHFYV